jgi:hypothetical protein
MRNPSNDAAVEAQPVGYGAIAAEDCRSASTAPNPPYGERVPLRLRNPSTHVAVEIQLADSSQLTLA